MTNKVYSFGYQGHDPEKLLQVTTAMGAALCDIRYSPLSKQAGWRKHNLQKMFGNSYEHIPKLGNFNYKIPEKIQIMDMPQGIERLLEILRFDSVILTCVCRDFNRCHRRLVAQELEKCNYEIEPLELLRKDVQQQRMQCEQERLF